MQLLDIDDEPTTPEGMERLFQALHLMSDEALTLVEAKYSARYGQTVIIFEPDTWPDAWNKAWGIEVIDELPEGFDDDDDDACTHCHHQRIHGPSRC